MNRLPLKIVTSVQSIALVLDAFAHRVNVPAGAARLNPHHLWRQYGAVSR